MPVSISYPSYIYVGEATGDQVYDEKVTIAGKQITSDGSITIAGNPARASNLAYPTVTGGFLVEASTVTLSRLRITPGAAIPYGVMVSSPHITIYKVSINDADGYYINKESSGGIAGIYFGAQSGYNRVDNCIINTGGADAVSDQGFGHNTFIGNGNNYTYPWQHVYDINAGGDGLVFGADSASNTVTAMSIQAVGAGIRDSGFGGNVLTGNGNPYTPYGSGYDIYDIRSSSDGLVISGNSHANTISGLTIKSAGTGILDSGGGGNTINGTGTFSDYSYTSHHTYDIHSEGDGIAISGASHGNTIGNVIIMAAGAGIRDSGAGGNIVTGNGYRYNYVYDISSGGDGIALSGVSQGNNFNYLTIQSAGTGILDSGAGGNHVRGYGNTYGYLRDIDASVGNGIEFGSASHGNIIDNVTIQASGTGIRDLGPGGNFINGNRHASNYWYYNISANGKGVEVSSAGANNVISSMTISAAYGVWDSGHKNTIEYSYVWGSTDAVHFDAYSSSNSIVSSTISGSERGFYSDGSYNSATASGIDGTNRAGVFFDRHATGNSLNGGNAYSSYGSGALFSGDAFSSADDVDFTGLRGVEIAGASSTTITHSYLSTQFEAGFGLYAVNSDSLTFSNNTVYGGVDGLGVWLEYGKALTVNLSANRVRGADTGMVIYSSVPYASTLNISGLIFESMPAMATAIDFWGSQVLTATFTAVDFNSTSILYDVIAYPALQPGSSIYMDGPSGTASGPDYAFDPLGYVSWAPPLAVWSGGAMPDGCGDGSLNVAQNGAAGAFTTIGAAAASLNGASLSTTTCIVIRDNQIYKESVLINNIATNGYRLVVMADPVFSAGARPVIEPPALSASAMEIRVASVTLSHIGIIAAASLPYGVIVSSPDVLISGLTIHDVDQDLGFIESAGIHFKGAAAHGIVDQTYISAGGAGILDEGAGSNSVTQSIIYSLDADAVSFTGDDNLVTGSLIGAGVSGAGWPGGGTGRSFYSNGARNSITLSRILVNAAAGVYLDSETSDNSVIDNDFDGKDYYTFESTGAYSNGLNNSVTGSDFSQTGRLAIEYGPASSSGTISNCTVSNDSYSGENNGVSIDGASVTVRSNSIYSLGTALTVYGIYQLVSDNSQIRSGWEDALVIYSSASLFAGNSVTGQYTGVVFEEGGYNILGPSADNPCTVTSYYDASVSEASPGGNTITQCSINSTYGAGISFEYVSGGRDTVTFSTITNSNYSQGLIDYGGGGNTISQSVISGYSGMELEGAGRNNIGSSSIRALDSWSTALRVGGEGGNIITGCVITAENGDGVALSGQGGNSISQSAISSNGIYQGRALYDTSQGGNTITLSSFFSNAYYYVDYYGSSYGSGLYLQNNSDADIISGSTITAPNGYGIQDVSGAGNIITQSSVTAGWYGVKLSGRYTDISESYISADGGGVSVGGSYYDYTGNINVPYGSTYYDGRGARGFGVQIEGSARDCSISLSTITALAEAVLFQDYYGDNMVSDSYIAAQNGNGVYFYNNSGDSVLGSTITTASSNARFTGVKDAGQYNFIYENYITALSTAVCLSPDNARYSTFIGNTVNASDIGINDESQGYNSIGWNQVSAVSTAVRLGPFRYYPDIMFGNVISGASTGLYIARNPQAVNGSPDPGLAIFGLTFQDPLPAGSTAIAFQGGEVFSAKFTDVAFNSTNTLVNVNAVSLTGDSLVNMVNAVGVSSGPAFENDIIPDSSGPGYVQWNTVLPPPATPGCDLTYNVIKDTDTPDYYPGIQEALDVFYADYFGMRPGNVCVIVRDTATYAGVYVEGVHSSPYSLTIMADPTFISSAPVVDPGLSEDNVGFNINTANVTIDRINVIPSAPIEFGIEAYDSKSLTISGVSILDAGGMITGAGINIYYGGLTLTGSTITVGNGDLGAGVLTYSNGERVSIAGSYIRGSDAVQIDDADTVSVSSSVLISNFDAGYGLYSNVSGGFSLIASTVTGGANGAGVWLSYYQGPLAIVLSSDTITGSAEGLVLQTSWLNYPAAFSVSDIVFRDIPAGYMSTAIDISGNQLIVSTFTNVSFDSPNIEVNVNAYPALSEGSNIYMAGHSGVKTGAAYAFDPLGQVIWGPVPPPQPWQSIPGCGSASLNVAQNGADGAFTTIRGAVESLNGVTLSTTTCIVIRDSKVYQEAVLVGSVTTNGYRLIIMGDPALGAAMPVVAGSYYGGDSSPALIQAGSDEDLQMEAVFQLMASSVTLYNLAIVPGIGIPYGVKVSSPDIEISSITIRDPNGGIWAAGIYLTEEAGAAVVKDNQLSMYYSLGIHDDSAGGNLIIRSRVFSRYNHGIYFSRADSEGGGEGVSSFTSEPEEGLSASSNNSVIDSTVEAGGYGFYSEGFNNILSRSVVVMRGTDGVYLEYNSSSNTVSSCRIEGSLDSYGYGLSSYGAGNSLLGGAVNVPGGGAVLGGTENLISGAAISVFAGGGGNDMPPAVSPGAFGESASAGIGKSGGGQDAGDGVRLEGEGSHSIINSIITTPGRYGVYDYSGGSNIISGSVISAGDYGVYIESYSGGDDTAGAGDISARSGKKEGYYSYGPSSISASVISAREFGVYYYDGSGNNTISGSSISVTGGNYGYGVYYEYGGGENSISASTVSAAGYEEGYGVYYYEDAGRNTIDASVISGVSGDEYEYGYGRGVYYEYGGGENTINSSVISAMAGGAEGYGTGVYDYESYGGNTISASTISATGAEYGDGVDYEYSYGGNTISGSVISAVSANEGYGVWDYSDGGNVVSGSVITSSGGSAGYGVYDEGYGGNTISASVISAGDYGIYDDSDGDNTVSASVISATGEYGYGIYSYAYYADINTSSISATGTGVTLSGGFDFIEQNTINALDIGIYEDSEGASSIGRNYITALATAAYFGANRVYYPDVLYETTISSASVGVHIARNNYADYGYDNPGLPILGLTFTDLLPGATAINFEGNEYFYSDFTNVDFNSSNIAVNVNGAGLLEGSVVNMVNSTGAVTGAGFENDVIPDLSGAGNVQWNTAVLPLLPVPAGCDLVYNVRWSDEGPKAPRPGISDFEENDGYYSSINDALYSFYDDYQGMRPGNTCIVIRDTQTYHESVWVDNLYNTGARLTIMGDPDLPSAPVIDPGYDNDWTAFYISNSSVTLKNLSIIPSGPIEFGVYVDGYEDDSFGGTIISSVTILDTGGMLQSAGILFGNTFDNKVIGSTITAGNGDYSEGVVVYTDYYDDYGRGDILVADSHIQGADAVIVEGARNAVITRSVLTSSDYEAGIGLYANGNKALTVSLSTVSGGGAGMGIWLDYYYDYYYYNPVGITLSSLTVTNAFDGLVISPQNDDEAGAIFDISNLAFNDPSPAGPMNTAISFMGGQVVTATFTAIAFESRNIEINVDAYPALYEGSEISMADAGGPRSGADYAFDPLGYVKWNSQLSAWAGGPMIPGCGPGSVNVTQAGTGDFISIGDAVASFAGAALSTTTCIVIRDTGTYDETIAVDGFTFTDPAYRFIITGDPALGAAMPSVVTREDYIYDEDTGIGYYEDFDSVFQVRAASVTLARMVIAPRDAWLSYGVEVSSPGITLSNVTIDDQHAYFNMAGVYFKTAAAGYTVIQSHINVTGDGSGILDLSPGGNLVSNSRIASNNFNAVQFGCSDGPCATDPDYEWGVDPVPQSDNNTVIASTLAAGTVGLYAYGNNNIVSDSVIVDPVSAPDDSGNVYSGLYFDYGTTGNSAVRTRINVWGTGAIIYGNANTVSSSTIVAYGGDKGGDGDGVILGDYGNHLISNSSISVFGEGTGLYFDGGDSNIVTFSTIAAQGWAAVYDYSYGNNTISESSINAWSLDAYAGIYIESDVDGDTISLSTVTTQGDHGIYHYYSYETAISSSYISARYTGVYDYSYGYNTISASTITAGDYGVYFDNNGDGSGDNAISASVITARYAGVYDYSYGNNIITESTITAGSYGVYDESSGGNSISSSVVSATDDYYGLGVYYHESGGNSISASSITAAGYEEAYGVYYDYGGGDNIITGSVISAASGDESESGYGSGVYYYDGYGGNIISGSSITATGVEYGDGVDYDYCDGYNAILGSVISATGLDEGYGVWDYSYGNNTISASTVTAAGGAYGYGVYYDNNGDYSGENTIAASVISAAGDNGSGVYDYSNGGNTITESAVSAGYYGVEDESSGYNRIHKSAINALSAVAYAGVYYGDNGSGNSISFSTVTSQGGAGVHDYSYGGTNIGASVISGSDFGILYDEYSGDNTLARSVVSSTGSYGTGVYDYGYGYNAISRSVISASNDAYAGVHFGGSSEGTIINLSAITAQGVYGVYDESYGYNTINKSVISAREYGIYNESTGENTVSASVISAMSTDGTGIYDYSYGSSITGSTISAAAMGVRIEERNGGQFTLSDNTIIPAVSGDYDTYGIYLNGLTNGADIHDNNIYYRSAGSNPGYTAYGLYAGSVTGLNFNHNRLNNPGMVTGGSSLMVYLDAVQSSDFKFNDVNSTGTGLTNAYLLKAADSDLTVKDNIFFSSWSVSGAAASLRIESSTAALNYNNWFGLNLAVLDGQSYPLARNWAAGYDDNSIFTDPLWHNPSAGAEDFHLASQTGRYLNGNWETTDAANSLAIDAADPAEPLGDEPAPNGGVANLGSYGGTVEASMTGLNQPVLVSPADGEIVITTTPVLDWVDSNSPYPGAVVSYELRYSTASDFSVFTTSSGLAVSQFTPDTGLTENARYYWSVHSYDLAAALVSPESLVRSFSVNAVNTTPAQPVLVSPSSGTIVAAPTLDWDDSADPDPGDRVRYEVHYSTAGDFSVYTASSGLTVSQFTPAGLTEGLFYFWKVYAYDVPATTSPVSVSWMFNLSAAVSAPGRPDLRAFVMSTTTVNWHWEPPTLSTGGAASMYILYTSTGGILATLPGSATGFIETDLSSTTSYTRYIKAMNVFGFEISDTITFVIPVFSEAVVGTSSGTVTDPGTNEVWLEFPAGAFSETSDFQRKVDPTLEPLASETPELIIAANGKLIGLTIDNDMIVEYLLTVNNNRVTENLDHPVTIYISYKDADDDGNVDGTSPPVRVDTLKIYWLDEVNQRWVEQTTTLDRVNKRLSAQVLHFSVYAALGAAAAADLSGALAYPNPWRPGSSGAYNAPAGVTFTNLTLEATIRIFTLSGDLVRKLDKVAAEGNQKIWDGRNTGGERVATGVYYYVISSPICKKATGRLAVVR